MPLASAREKEEIIMNANPAATIVLVHGGFVDGSGWRPLYDLLTQDGYHVAVVQNPTLSLQGDAAATRLIIDAQDGPVVLVGHSYGGAVISEAGTDPNVAALVYICAFAPDKDESVNTLIAGFPADGPQPPILPPRDGFLFLDRGQIPRLVRRRRACRSGRVHGRLAGPLGPGRPRRAHHRPCLADQAELVHGHHRRPNDPLGGPAHHVPAGWVDRGRGGGQSLRLRIAAGRRGGPHQNRPCRRSPRSGNCGACLYGANNDQTPRPRGAAPTLCGNLGSTNATAGAIPSPRRIGPVTIPMNSMMPIVTSESDPISRVLAVHRPRGRGERHDPRHHHYLTIPRRVRWSWESAATCSR
jgi:pimeloyl-ACP methyl ester carboxylesterase